MKAAVLTIGDELLIGQVVDTNSAWIGSRLYDHGIEVVYIESLGDHKEKMVAALKRAQRETDLILLTGGLGPTKDDITKKVLCEVMQCGLFFSDATYNHIQRMFEQRGIPLREAHREQCMLPDRAEILINARGTAPGMLFDWDGAMLVSMPGVPHEMQYLMTHEVLPRIRGKSNLSLAKRTIRTAGVPESSVAAIVEPLLQDKKTSIAYLPSRGQVRLRLSRREEGTSVKQLQQEVDLVTEELVTALGESVYGYDDDELETAIGKMLLERELNLATAESCSGGYVAHLVTSVPGASRYFSGSIIAYSNEVKMNLLQVKEQTLLEYGAVSTQVTEEMLHGLLTTMNADVGIAISGIAGPGGGTPDKPVGTICITVGSLHQQISKRILVGKDRLTNIRYSAAFAFNMLRKFLLHC